MRRESAESARMSNCENDEGRRNANDSRDWRSNGRSKAKREKKAKSNSRKYNNSRNNGRPSVGQRMGGGGIVPNNINIDQKHTFPNHTHILNNFDNCFTVEMYFTNSHQLEGVRLPYAAAPVPEQQQQRNSRLVEENSAEIASEHSVAETEVEEPQPPPVKVRLLVPLTINALNEKFII